MRKLATRGGHDTLGKRPEDAAKAVAAAQQATAQWARSLSASGSQILLRDVDDLLAWGEKTLTAPPEL